MVEVLSVVAIIIAGLMVGCELAIAAFVHPALDQLPDDVHLPAASALARMLGTVMPVWYPLVFGAHSSRRHPRMEPVWASTDLVRYFGHFVDVGECVFAYITRADQQPY